MGNIDSLIINCVYAILIAMLPASCNSQSSNIGALALHLLLFLARPDIPRTQTQRFLFEETQWLKLTTYFH
ncbi:hypothetical protein Pfo_014799 [Paulownia fortunei]|nr:hypothetical protein Pfo_014799 [Paulownia fortunei]